MFSHGAVANLDLTAAAPASKAVAVELTAAVADEVFRRGAQDSEEFVEIFLQSEDAFEYDEIIKFLMELSKRSEERASG